MVNPEPVSYSEGRQDTFYLLDLLDLEVYRRQFELRLVTPHAYWYVEEGLSVRQRDLERSAEIFEEDIYPRVTAIFGEEWSPGVDNDPHLNVISARLAGRRRLLQLRRRVPEKRLSFQQPAGDYLR